MSTDAFLHKISFGTAKNGTVSFGTHGNFRGRRTAVVIPEGENVALVQNIVQADGTVASITTVPMSADDAQALACALLDASAHLRREAERLASRDRTPQPAQKPRTTHSRIKHAAAAAAISVLTACGGGSDQPDDEADRTPTPTVTCSTFECVR